MIAPRFDSAKIEAHSGATSEPQLLSEWHLLPLHVGFNTCCPLPCRGQAGKRLTDKGVTFLTDLDVDLAPVLPDGCHFSCLTVLRL